MTTAQQSDLQEADSPRLWLRAPAEAHRLWREGQQLGDPARLRAYADHSTRQYCSLFGRFCQWMAGQRVDVKTLTGDDIARFLDGLTGRGDEPASDRTKRMYLAEIDRVMQRLVDLEVRRGRPTEILLDQVKHTTPLKRRHIVLPGVDVVGALEAFAAKLHASRPAQEPSLRRAFMASAMAALMLRGGLTPKELQKLRVKSITSAGSRLIVSAPGHRLLQDRDVELAGWAATCVERWCAFRVDSLTLSLQDAPDREAKTRSAHLFSHEIPGGHGRKSDRALTGKSMYEAVQALCKEAGLKIDLGPQILRNIFIAGLVKDGLPDSEIALRAGLLKNEQVLHVRNALPRPARPSVR